MRPFFVVAVVLIAACTHPRPANPPPARAPRDTTRVRIPAPVRDTALEQHAARLELPHPVTGAPLDLRCPLPDALLGLLASLREDA